jgi:ATP-dependent RNA helicase DeaD
MEGSAPKTFDALPLSPELRRAIDAIGYVHPTPVQIAVFEPATRGKNLVVQARTGTGKTAAFGLPLLDVLVKRGTPAVQALVLTPTRELALQVSRELEKLAEVRGTKIIAIYGGAAMGPQVDALANGAQIVVGTPGRVLDHIRRGTLKTDAIRTFVLDEADEMLSMGFAKELHAIAESLPKERQGLFFSATIPPDIERMAKAQLKDPEFVTLSSDQVGALEIAHYVYLIPGGDKRDAIFRILEVEDPESAILFCNTKDETERLAEYLKQRGFDAEWLNGDLEQRERERVMSATREGKLRFLVATDVAARGIDVSHLTHVINADFPESAENYVHRTGRTGRAGRTGTAISVVGPKEMGSLYMMRLTYKIRPIEKHLPSRQELKTREEADLVQMFVDAYAARTHHPEDLALTRRLLTHPAAEQVIAGLIRDHLGARPDAKTTAAEARRAKNPEPHALPSVEAPKPEPREGARVEPRVESRPETRREGERKRAPTPTLRSTRTPRKGGGAPHATYTEWEPPEESDDDKPILDTGSSMPRFTVEDVPFSSEPPTLKRPLKAPSTTGSAGPTEAEDEPGFVQIFLNVGRRDGVKTSDLLGLLETKAAITKTQAGRVRIRDRVSFVGVRPEDLERAIGAFAGASFGGRTVVAEKAKAKPGDEKRDKAEAKA